MQEQIAALFHDAFGSDVTITTTNLSLVVEYTGEEMASWTSFLEKLGKEFIINSTEERVIAVANEEAMEEKRQEYVSILEEMGFQELAGYCRSTENAPAEYRPTAAETTVISLFSAAVLALSQVIESPTDEQVEKFLDTYKLLKQIVDAKVSLRAAEFNLQCAIDNGDAWWENGCRNEIFKQEFAISKAFTSLHA